jgi:hypothetical protein
LYVVCGGDDSGKLLVADTDPTPSSTISYTALPANVYHLRMTGDTNEIYLEVTPEMVLPKMYPVLNVDATNKE